MGYQQIADELLVKLLKVDDEESFREIYVRYFKVLFRLGLKKLDDSEKVEDCVQDIFMNIWEKRHSNTINNLEAYLKNALKYKIIDIYRQKIVLEEIPSNANLETLATSSEHNLTIKEINFIIVEQLKKLPPKTNTIFQLSRFQYKSAREIAEMLNIPERTVEYHISKALEHLRFHLKDYTTILVFLNQI
jgi:RNA polymerase sigma-70 factor (family 1)